jgi:hypothetical protein
MIQRPAPTEYASFYGTYMKLVPESDILNVLRNQHSQVVSQWRSIAEKDSTILHPPYTWTIKQVIGHISDGERVFSYRALRIARGDATPLAGFDENQFALAADIKTAALAKLVDEFDAVRQASFALFSNLLPASWARTGTANENPVSVRALAWIMAGHVRHHDAIIRKRLGLPS